MELEVSIAQLHFQREDCFPKTTKDTDNQMIAGVFFLSYETHIAEQKKGIDAAKIANYFISKKSNPVPEICLFLPPENK